MAAHEASTTLCASGGRVHMESRDFILCALREDALD